MSLAPYPSTRAASGVRRAPIVRAQFIGPLLGQSGDLVLIVSVLHRAHRYTCTIAYRRGDPLGVTEVLIDPAPVFIPRHAIDDTPVVLASAALALAARFHALRATHPVQAVVYKEALRRVLRFRRQYMQAAAQEALG